MDLIDKITELTNLAKAHELAIDQLTRQLPKAARRFMEKKSDVVLDSTRDNYLSALSYRWKDSVFVVAIDEDNWLANAVEEGASGFDMKEGLLTRKTGNNVKISKKGHKYRVIPVKVDPTKAAKASDTIPAGADSAIKRKMEFKFGLKNALAGSKFDLKEVQQDHDGAVNTKSLLNTADPRYQGLFKMESYDSQEEYISGNPSQSAYMMFRVVSSNPFSSTGATWQHPGIEEIGLFKHLKSRLPIIANEIFDRNLEMAMDILENDPNKYKWLEEGGI